MKKIEYDYAEWYNNDSNIAVWFIEGESVGIRLQQHDWKEGDKVMNNGKMTEIYSIVTNTEDNRELLSDMVRECKYMVSGSNSSKTWYRKHWKSAMEAFNTTPRLKSKYGLTDDMSEKEMRSLINKKIDEDTFEKVFEIIDKYLDKMEEVIA